MFYLRPFFKKLLCAALCLSALTSCGASGKPAESTVSESTTEAQPAETAATAPELSQFMVTRPDGQDGYLTTMNSLLASIKRMTGVELTPNSDLVVANRREPEFEILLGETRRALSQELYESLPLGGYAVVYRDGKIAIAGRGDEPLAAAVEYFMDHYFVDRVFTLPENTDFRAEYKYENFYSVLEGKSINVMGDSYVSAGSLPDGKIWPQLLAEKYEMDYRSYGKGGNAIASTKASGTPMVTRYREMRGGVDIVFVVGGRNDYNQDYPVGQVGDTTTDTFCGALSVLIDGLREKYPDSLILFSTSWYVNADMKAYTDATLAVCNRKGIPCFHAADQSLSGVYMDQPAFRSTYCIKPTDVSHLNAAGMKLVLPKYENFIAEEAEKFFK
jgi:hypothetical protein